MAGDAAAQALRDGLLEVTRTETKGKTTIEWVRLTPRGVDFLHEHESPVPGAARAARRPGRPTSRRCRSGWPRCGPALQALDARLAADAAKWQQKLDGLERRLDETLRRLEEATPELLPEVTEAIPWAADAVNHLDRRRATGSAGPCPLPDLFDSLVREHPALSLSAFHEGLRRLSDRHVLRLRPIDDLAELSRAEFALLDAGRVLYFASR